MVIYNSYSMIKTNVFVSQGLSEAPDLEFEYSDADNWAVELSGERAICFLYCCFLLK